MINKLINKIWIAILIVGISGCTKDSYLMPWDDNSPEGKVRVELQLHAAQSEIQLTRSVNPEEILGKDVYVLVLDGIQNSSKLKQRPARAVDTQGDKIYTVLNEEEESSFLYVVSADMDETTKNYLENTAKVGTTLEELQSKLLLASATVKGLTSPLPMSGLSTEMPQIKKGTSFATTIEMLRAVARIDVEISSIITKSNFTLTGIALANGAKNGWLIPAAKMVAQSGASTVQYEMVTPNDLENKITGKVYCYENNGQLSQFTDNPTRIVIKGKYNGSNTETFYGINIAYAPDPSKATELNYDIKRNMIYTVRVNKVQKSGYTSLEEAIKNPQFNMAIEAEITVTDPYAHDIVTNGKQYLGATNSNFLVHPNSEKETVKGAAVATISYTTESTWSVGQIILPAGLTFSNGNNGRLELGNGNTPVVREISVDIPADFKEGDIIVSIGNLTKTIHVKRSTSISALGGICEDFAKEEYKVGEVINFSQSTAWVKLSDQREPQGESSLLNQINNPLGKIYVHFTSNIGFSNSASPREAQLYIASGEGEARARILVQQNAYEIYHDANNVQIENSYVGTFHRWNQTAERIIRIDASKYNTDRDKWSATVVSGNDFIVLSTDAPKDNQIFADDPLGKKTTSGPQYSTDDEIEANCQVDGNAVTVEGTGRTIYFKVGLKSRLSSAEVQPRYGLIAIVHSGGNHLIYVRQGESADYLMRPWDEWKESGGNGYGRTRNKVCKISPYNLTDPQKSTNHEIDRGKRGYIFTDYPSQSGYYFMGPYTKAYPKQNLGTTTSVSSMEWNDNYESCPRGYRRPKDDGAVSNSEVRLSFWLYPSNEIGKSDITNQYRGYLADGYFDRHTIEQSSISGLSDYKSAYVKGSTPGEMAYQGTLFYNPQNMASVFIPEAGSYTGFTLSWLNGMDAVGYWGGIYTSRNDGGYFLINTGINPISRAVTCDMYSTYGDVAWSIRCVKDENSPIINDGENTVNPFPDADTEIKLISHNLKPGSSLQAQLEAEYTDEELKKMYTINIYGNKLTDADYAYLNSLATNTIYPLQHLIVSGANNKSLPTNAFTSPRWVSISLVDVTDVPAKAFNITSTNDGYWLKNIKFGSYDKIAVASDAFAFPGNLDTGKTLNLFLAGKEYALVKDTQTWGGITWNSIKNYYGKK